MTTLREAAEMALEALEVATTPRSEDRQTVLKAQAALRAALAEQTVPSDCPDSHQPVAYGYIDARGNIRPINHHEMKMDRIPLYTFPPQRKPLTDDDLEPLRIRIMGEAYNAADEGQSEEYNAIKVLCAVLLDLVKRAVTSLDTANSKEAQLDYIAQQIKNVVSSFNISKSLPVADTESDVLTATYMLGVHAGKKATNRKPLTDEKIIMLSQSAGVYIKVNDDCDLLFARAIERAHGIGG